MFFDQKNTPITIVSIWWWPNDDSRHHPEFTGWCIKASLGNKGSTSKWTRVKNNDVTKCRSKGNALCSLQRETLIAAKQHFTTIWGSLTFLIVIDHPDTLYESGIQQWIESLPELAIDLIGITCFYRPFFRSLPKETCICSEWTSMCIQ